jgi:UDP-N-acetylmuramate--L-alanine ligase/UDP-N-acetylenolpyruvoylglucosamine reductase
MTAPTLPPLFSREVRRIHCIGAGGMGVAPLAVYLRQLGFVVSGEDDAMTDEVRALLQREGVSVGPMSDDCDLVMHSSAIAKTHPTYRAAEARGLPLVRRGEMLAESVRGKKLVAVCGSHGKTTTTAMLITALRRMNFQADYVLGGLFADGSPPAHAGKNEWVVAEIDESDGTIAGFSPEITLVVNLDWDHPDQYRRLEDLERAFAELFARTRGTVLTSEACALSRTLRSAAAEPERFPTFGPAGDFAFELRGEAGVRMELALGGRFAIAEASVRANGHFNAANAAAALAAAQLMGAKLAADALADFPAVRRRQAVLHAADGITVIEDYAHHPGEIRALLSSLRQRAQASGGRLLVVFQPHRFSRTLQFKAEFAASLALADRLFLLDVYGAGEAPIAGGATADVVAELKRAAPTVKATYSADEAEVFVALTDEVRAGDLVAFVGAGDIDKKARAWLAERGLGGGAMAATRWDAFVAAVQPLVSPATKLQREESLGRKTTTRIGGAARIYAEPASVADLQTLLRTAAAQRIKVFLLGRGSNLLVPDEGVDGLVISLVADAWAKFEPRADGRVWAGAGLRLKNLCGLAAKAGLSGFEFLEGIPGSVGGALRMNAGAMGGWMFDVVEELQLMRPDGQVLALPRIALHVQYRHCAELQNAIALGALLRPVAQADAEAVNRQIAMYRRKRQESQPREPSAGCIFRNPPGNSAGRLIDESGLKGARVGDAEVSPVHANFIVNRGHATAADVLELVRRVRARVKEVRGVDLEPEVLLYGQDWKDVL